MSDPMEVLDWAMAAMLVFFSLLLLILTLAAGRFLLFTPAADVLCTKQNMSHIDSKQE